MLRFGKSSKVGVKRNASQKKVSSYFREYRWVVNDFLEIENNDFYLLQAFGATDE